MKRKKMESSRIIAGRDGRRENITPVTVDGRDGQLSLQTIATVTGSAADASTSSRDPSTDRHWQPSAAAAFDHHHHYHHHRYYQYAEQSMQLHRIMDPSDYNQRTLASINDNRCFPVQPRQLDIMRQ